MTKKIAGKPFFIEIFFVLVTLTFCCAVLTALYAGVAKTARESSDKESTVLAVQSRVERFFVARAKVEALKEIGIKGNETTATKGFDKNWVETTQKPYYTVVTDTASVNKGSGQLLTVNIKVERDISKSGEDFYSLSTQKYFSEVG